MSRRQNRARDLTSWLCSTRTPRSPAAECTFYVIIATTAMVETFDRPQRREYRRVVRALSRPTREHVLRLRAWRFRPFDLDLLQLAVLCQKSEAVDNLLRHGVFDEDHYEGSSGPINHPVHLACHVENPSILRSLTQHLPDVHVEKGAVTVTPNHDYSSPFPVIQLLPGQTLTGYPGDLLIGGEVEEASPDLDEERDSWQRVKRRRTPVQVTSTTKRCLACLYKYYCMSASTRPHQVSLDFIKIVWNDFERLVSGMTFYFHEIALQEIGNLPVDAALPLYQLAVALSWEDPVLCSTVYLDFLRRLDDDHAVALFTSMRRDQLCHLVKVAEDCILHILSIQEKVDETITKLQRLQQLAKETQQGRTLLQECGLAILQSLKGNCIKVLELPLPKPLMTTFRVPFLERYEELCSTLQ